MPTTDKALLSGETKIYDLAFFQEQLWFINEKSLYRLSVDKNQLNRYDLINQTTNQQLLSLDALPQSLYIFSEAGYYKLLVDESVFKKINIDFPSVPDFLKMISPGEVFFTANKKSFYFYIADKKLQFYKDLVELSKNPAVFDKKNKNLWWLEKNSILRMDFASKEVIKVIDIKDLFIGIQTVNEESVLAYTKKHVLKFNLNGSLEQTIPVLQDNDLVFADFTNSFHSFLFSDQSVEVFDLENKNSARYQLHLGEYSHIQKIISFRNYIVFLVDKRLRLFKFPKK